MTAFTPLGTLNPSAVRRFEQTQWLHVPAFSYRLHVCVIGILIISSNSRKQTSINEWQKKDSYLELMQHGGFATTIVVPYAPDSYQEEWGISMCLHFHVTLCGNMSKATHNLTLADKNRRPDICYFTEMQIMEVTSNSSGSLWSWHVFFYPPSIFLHLESRKEREIEREWGGEREREREKLWIV